MPEQHPWNAALYTTNHSYVAKFGNDVVTLLHPQNSERILDLGCGTGELTHTISLLAKEVIGIDSSSSMIAKAQQQFPSLTFEVANGHDFHFDEPFDAIFSNAALHWMLEPKKVIQCVWQNLKPQGRFVFEMGGKGNIAQVLRYIATAAQEFGVEHLPLQNYFPSLAEYTSLLEAQGFRVTFAEHFDRPTVLEGEHGLRNWLKMFRPIVLQVIAQEQHEAFFKRLETQAAATLYSQNRWWADYVRLRAVAIKE